MFNRTKKRIGFILLIFSIFLALVVINRLTLISKKATDKATAAGALVTVTYQPSAEDFANPERGFMRQSSIYPDQNFDPNKITSLQSSDTLVWVYFRLDNYRTKPLDQSGLDNIRSAFTTARSKGLKLVIRFVYNPGPGSTTDPNQANPDAPLSLVLQHINQLQPILVENSDVTAAVQIGFVGHWGEWHSTKYLADPADKKAVVDALLAAVPKDRMLMIRYPRYKEMFFQGPLVSQEAFSQSDRSRIGHHNDCFLRDLDDTTYKSRTGQPPTHQSNYCIGQDEIACWKGFVAQETQFTPMGGETCQYNPPRSECANALQELAMFHWSFINNGYRPEVLNSWVTGGCMPEIRQRLGYRLALKSLSISQHVSPGGNLEFHLELENNGFASPFNLRPAILVLKNSSSNFQKEIPLSSVDIRRWLPGQAIKVDLNIPIPQDVPNGSYNVYLWLPDASSSLKSRFQYAIRLANQNVWQPATGYNLLFNSLVVSGTPQSPTPGGTGIPTPTPGPNSAKLKFKIQLPDVLSTTANIPSSDVQVELKDGTTTVGTSNVGLTRSGNYFQTAAEIAFNIPQNKAYSVVIKAKISLRRMFAGVSLTQSQTLDCTVTSNTSCGELITARDTKVFLSGDSDGFTAASGSFNKVDSADLQALASFFNQQATGQASFADFNLDGTVNISDLEILGKNYGSVGD